ncbi:MAG: aminotransferase class V-fold PLP-dependent enzyme [Acidimicrobiia bacterium]
MPTGSDPDRAVPLPRSHVYLDHAASTALRPEARAAADLVAADGPANPTGAHRDAQRMRAHLEAARESIAALWSVAPHRVVFTSGGTESDNTAIAAGATRGRVLYSAVEHPAVLEPAVRTGGEAIPVDALGVVDLDALVRMLTSGAPVGIVSVMAANNETGVLQPLDDVAAVVETHAPTAWLHTDAVQAFTKVPVAAGARGLASVSAHKLGGPIGSGALVLGDDVEPEPLLWGGGQERGLRAGTPDPVASAAFAAAACAAAGQDWGRVGVLRDRLEAGLRREVDDLVVHGAAAQRLPTHCHVGIAGVTADMVVIACDRAGLAVSSGSSCASGAQKASGVLAAMGVSDEGALRLSLGWNTTADQVDFAVGVVARAVAGLRT